MAQRRSPLHRLRRILLITLATFAGLFILLNYVLMPLYVRSGGTMTVPDVTGVPLEQARVVVDSAGLEAVEAGSRPDPKAPVGTVVGQNPVAGSVVKEGRRVYLTVSGGEVLVTVPRVRGQSVRDARFTLERTGLRVGATTFDTSGLYPRNTVMAQSIVPGAKVARGTEVGVTVSRGTEFLQVLVPDLSGRTLSEAQKLLSDKSLRAGVITYQPSADLIPNTVVDQFPRGGEMVEEGHAVDLFVVKAGSIREEIPRKEEER
jgi:serine/threonine-protein kinase